MCWFIHFAVVLQKDTPHARSRVHPFTQSPISFAGAFPEFTIPDGICGCAFVIGEGLGVVPDVQLILDHYLHLDPVKRVDVWWHWTRESERQRPASEEAIDWPDFVSKNLAGSLNPDKCYRITDLLKFQSYGRQ